jgi:hypothetical protein
MCDSSEGADCTPQELMTGRAGDDRFGGMEKFQEVHVYVMNKLMALFEEQGLFPPSEDGSCKYNPGAIDVKPLAAIAVKFVDEQMAAEQEYAKTNEKPDPFPTIKDAHGNDRLNIADESVRTRMTLIAKGALAKAQDVYRDQTYGEHCVHNTKRVAYGKTLDGETQNTIARIEQKVMQIVYAAIADHVSGPSTQEEMIAQKKALIEKIVPDSEINAATTSESLPEGEEDDLWGDDLVAVEGSEISLLQAGNVTTSESGSAVAAIIIILIIALIAFLIFCSRGHFSISTSKRGWSQSSGGSLFACLRD